jgi:hypothetical protein
MRVAKLIELNPDDDRRLRILSKCKRIEARLQLRARIAVTLFAPAYVALILVGAALATFARFDRPPLSP